MRVAISVGFKLLAMPRETGRVSPVQRAPLPSRVPHYVRAEREARAPDATAGGGRRRREDVRVLDVGPGHRDSFRERQRQS